MAGKVAIRKCSSYMEEELQSALDRLISDLGGWDRYVLPGEKVLLKVNLVAARDPSLAATTHPMFVEAVAKSLVSYGCDVWIGDSPGGLFNEAVLKKNYRITGMEEAARRSGAHLSFELGESEREFHEGAMLKRMVLSDMVTKADKVISLCKLKTHTLMLYTGAVKNMFGAIPGTYKAQYHLRMPEGKDFGTALLDIYQAVCPVLTLMDAVIGMEGNGPTNGKPRKIGALLGSADAPSLDLLATSLISVDAHEVPYLDTAISREMIPDKAQSLEIVGDEWRSLVITDIKIPDNYKISAMDQWMKGPLRRIAEKTLRSRVTFDETRCIGCGECVADCPAKALSFRENKNKKAKAKRVPQVDNRKCIRCYCCQELCPGNAVTVKTGLAFKIANKL